MPVLAASHAAVASEFRPYANVKLQTPYTLNVMMMFIFRKSSLEIPWSKLRVNLAFKDKELNLKI